MKALGGDCHTPLAGHARFEDSGSRLRFDGWVGALDDARMVRAGTERYTDAQGKQLFAEARALGDEAAQALLAQGGGDLIEEAKAAADARSDPRNRPQH